MITPCCCNDDHVLRCALQSLSKPGLTQLRSLPPEVFAGYSAAITHQISSTCKTRFLQCRRGQLDRLGDGLLQPQNPFPHVLDFMRD